MIASPKLGDEEYLPARMLNEFVYCPRLFYYEHVQGLFAHNRETVEGSLRHESLDQKTEGLPPPEELVEGGPHVRARGITLASDQFCVIARMDIVEADGGRVTPVDYKRGRPCQSADGSLDAWDADKTQLAVQALVLRENGYHCDQAIVYYAETRQRVRLTIDDRLIARTIETIAAARSLAAGHSIPPPLADSPKCPRCSLVGICLPDETRRCAESACGGGQSPQRLLFEVDMPRSAALSDDAADRGQLRRLVPARDDLRPLYLNSQGLYVSKSGQVLKLKDKDREVQEVRINEICQLNLMGNIQLTTQAIQALCEAEVPIAYFSLGGWFYGMTQGLGVKNVFLRREQFRWAEVPTFCLRLARALVAGKIRNQRTVLQRNHVEPPSQALALMKSLQEESLRAESMEQLLGIEGNAARAYFENFAGMLKVAEAAGRRADAGCDGDASSMEIGPPPAGSGESSGEGFRFDFHSRNRRPPRDPVNALLSLGYSLLAKDLTIVTQTVGFDPYLGFFHQPRFGRASLALDLMEPFRPLIADSAVLSAINTRMVTLDDFVRAGHAVALTPDGRKKFFRAYEQRMDTLVTHPLFGYRVNYRRLLETQTRLLARVLTGEMSEYVVFTTR